MGTRPQGTLIFPDGSIGSVQDISVRPFVTGFIPVVGGYYISPLAERMERLRQEAAGSLGKLPSDRELLLGVGKAKSEIDRQVSRPTVRSSHSTAERGDVSLAEIRRSQISAPSDPDGELKQLIEQARLAEVSSRFGAARIRYQRAAAKATGELKQALLAKAKSLKGK